jgi:phosphoribosylanthranilate isomerase
METNNNLNATLGFRDSLKIKICGMKFPDNIQAVTDLKPDFLGFIFYPKSPRYAEPLDIDLLLNIPRNILKIGVFVNETQDNILETVKKYSLQGVQLHGSESEELCYTLKSIGLLVFKAFQIAEAVDFNATEDYEGACDFFIFDTKTAAHGGSGVKFDWSILSEYKGETRFLLSGGISLEDVETIKLINHPKLAGVDLNSRFEISPGIKNVDLLAEFFSNIKRTTKA